MLKEAKSLKHLMLILLSFSCWFHGSTMLKAMSSGGFFLSTQVTTANN